MRGVGTVHGEGKVSRGVVAMFGSDMMGSTYDRGSDEGRGTVRLSKRVL